LQAVRSIARSVTLHDRGAGVDNGTHLVSALGNSRWAPGSPWFQKYNSSLQVFALHSYKAEICGSPDP